MTKAWKPLSEKRAFNRLAKELKRERKTAQPTNPVYEEYKLYVAQQQKENKPHISWGSWELFYTSKKECK